MILMILGTLLGVPLSPGNRIKITLWQHMDKNGANGSKIVPRAPKMVPSGPKMTPQLSPKSYKYHRNMILKPSGTVAVLGAHATVDNQSPKPRPYRPRPKYWAPPAKTSGAL